MFTCCPACQTLFRVRAETLRVAQGEVRCGRCGAQFNALDSLAEDPETLTVSTKSAVATETAAVGPTGGTEQQSESPIGSGDRDNGDIRSEPIGDAAARPPNGAAVGQFHEGMTGISAAVIQEALLSEEPSRRGHGPGTAAGLLVLLLLFVLTGQWLYMQRVPLYDRPELRPLLQGFCKLLACDLPLPRMPEQIEVLERMVREHPRVAQALLVNLTFVSRAREPIAYPILELQLADVSGNRIAARRFAPAEYLAGDIDLRRGMSPERPLALALELMAPATEVVSFQFEFL